MSKKKECKCGCGTSISHKHPNAKFLNNKHKNRFHNSQPHRIERTKQFNKKTKTVRVVDDRSNLERMLDEKINHPFAEMSE